MQTVVICCGGSLGEWSLPILDQADYIIGADRGALYVIECNYTLDIALGDFDSCNANELHKIKSYANQITIVDAIDKNETDSELALQHAMSLQPRTIIMIGATGTRIDHALNNIQLLVHAAESKSQFEIVDAHNRIQLITPEMCKAIDKLQYNYISFIPLTERVEGIQLVGFKYPLKNATFTLGSAIGISNQIIEESGTVSIQSGKLLCVQSND